jgi:thiol:disulfide interchange protein DsbD
VFPLRLLPLLAVLLLAPPAHAQGLSLQTQVPRPEQLVRIRPESTSVAAGGEARARVTLSVLAGWHINANPPALDYMIPTELELESAPGLTKGRAKYPPPRKAKLSFEDTELLVYDGEAVIEIPIRAEAGAAPGERAWAGAVRFQACNDQVCLPPASLPFVLKVGVMAGPPASSGSAAEPAPLGTGPTPLSGDFEPAPTAAVDPVSRLFERGSFVAFLSLFLIGLALNLTPCIYPMLGVTVSVFGARGAAAPGKAIGHAILYVLGIAIMYSTLGVVAAMTGGLFGGFLQSPIVLVLIGVLLTALALSMFGLYEFQPPAALLNRLGGAGAAGAVGIFLSGLVVGLFAAPCIGPPVVALLALVGAKGDPWFGFLTFFTLSLGLGAPYLVLATFSNLVQRLPRSGEWMVWVKKLFGVILLAVGAFYVLLGVAPKLAPWVLPVALIAGGLYLGFFERSQGLRKGFRWLRLGTGVTGLLAGVLIVATTPREGIAFRPYDPATVPGDLPRARPVMLDFTADWCVPCHELERYTFTDPQVREAAKAFDAYKVDLTRPNSPGVDQWQRQYRIRGVPTIVFLDVRGNEIPETRVEGFMPPALFLDRMRLAAAPSQEAASAATGSSR